MLSTERVPRLTTSSAHFGSGKTNMSEELSSEDIEAAIVSALQGRDPASSSCPSEVARQLHAGGGPHWRQLMPEVRAAAARLARLDRITITRGATVLPPDDLEGGPIRLR